MTANSTPKPPPTLEDYNWQNTLDKILPHVFSIKTPSGSGTGFVVARSADSKTIGIATAYHVIAHAYEWSQPIKVVHNNSGNSQLLNQRNRSVHVNESRDSALIRLPAKHFPLSANSLKRIKEGYYKRAGVEVGWCGFPAVYPSKPCFFSGRISAYLTSEEAYLVDGIAINGVSGGPAFDIWGDIFGLVTAYIPNRATGEPLPGVSLIRSIHSMVEFFKKIEGTPVESTPDTTIAEPVKPVAKAPDEPPKRVEKTSLRSRRNR